MRISRVLMGFVAIGALSGAADAADVTLHQRTSGGLETTEYWSGSKRARDLEDVRIIIDVHAGTVTTLDKENKTYVVQKIDEVQAKRVAPATSAGNGKPGKGADGTAVKVESTGKTETIAGYEAKGYTFTSAPATGELWMSESLQGPDFSGQARAMVQLSDPGSGTEALAKALEQVKGAPLRTTLNTPEGGLISTTVVFELREGIPADAFTIPSDYKKTEPPKVEKKKSDKPGA
jgi:uncharacterized protein DUF4412